MEMNRRRFLWLAGALAVAAAVRPWRWLAGLGRPRRVVIALRGSQYPGQVLELADTAVTQAGKWAG